MGEQKIVEVIKDFCLGEIMKMEKWLNEGCAYADIIFAIEIIGEPEPEAGGCFRERYIIVFKEKKEDVSADMSGFKPFEAEFLYQPYDRLQEEKPSPGETMIKIFKWQDLSAPNMHYLDAEVFLAFLNNVFDLCTPYIEERQNISINGFDKFYQGLFQGEVSRHARKIDLSGITPLLMGRRAYHSSDNESNKLLKMTKAGRVYSYVPPDKPGGIAIGQEANLVDEIGNKDENE